MKVEKFSFKKYFFSVGVAVLLAGCVRNSMQCKKPNAAVVLYTGAAGSKEQLEPIRKLIKKKMPEVELYTPEWRLDGWGVWRLKLSNTIGYSVSKQAEESGKEIEKAIKSWGKNPKEFPLYCVGYSQGATVGWMDELEFKDRLKIIGKASKCGVLGKTGVPLLGRTRSDVSNFRSNNREGLLSPSWKTYMYGASYMYGAPVALGFLRWSGWGAGLHDLLPNSGCLKKISSYTGERPAAIPTYIVGTVANDLGVLYRDQLAQAKASDEDKKLLNERLAEWVTGSKTGLHDTLVPLETQIGVVKGYDYNEDKENLIRELDNQGGAAVRIPRGNSKVKIKVMKDIPHAGNDMATNSYRLFDSEEDALWHSKRVDESIVAEIKKVFSDYQHN